MDEAGAAMTWETAASGNVRRALALELTMLLDACCDRIAMRNLALAYAWALALRRNGTGEPEQRHVLDSRKGLKRTRGVGKPNP